MSFKNIIKNIRDESTDILDGDLFKNEAATYIDTGSYMLNGLLSASIFGGVAGNKITAFAGEEATGKTFFALNILKNFQSQNPDGYIAYSDTEFALSPEMFGAHGLDPSHIVLSRPVTVEEYRKKCIQILDGYINLKEKDKPPLVMVLDSLGNLSSEKEVEEAEKDSGVKDMTKQAVIKATLRVLSLKYLAKANVPLIVTNHVYASMSLYTPKQMSGGSGLKYLASTICYLSKAKDKDDKTKETLGNIVTVRLKKGRFSREDSTCEVKLSHKHGMDRYYGLLDISEEYDIVKRIGNQYEMPDGSKHFRKEIEADGAKFFSDDTLLKRIDEAVKDKYAYKIG